MKNIVICLSSDNNYVQHMAATISSVLKNKNEDEFIKTYIIDGGIDEKNKEKLNLFENEKSCKITYLQPDIKKLQHCKESGHLSLATFYRLLIPDMVQEDRVIYLDCDIIVRKSLNELYNLSFNNNLILGVQDVGGLKQERLNTSNYINTGMILINAKQMREEKSVEYLLNWISNNQDIIQNHDQDIINGALSDRIGIIDDKYNTQVLRKNCNHFDKIKDPTILHFISSQKPWSYLKPMDTTPWAKLYFEALKDTCWADFILEHKIKYALITPIRLLYPTGFIKKILQNIFSIKNTPDRKYKIIKILGIKITRERKKERNKQTIKILVCYHKKAKIFKNNIFVPIHCGRKIAFRNSKDGKISKKTYSWLLKNTIGDDTGENISEKNRYLNEMTAIYWAWKNYDKLKNPDYIGLNHYRRYFKTLYYKNLFLNTLSEKRCIFLNKPMFDCGIKKQWQMCVDYDKCSWDDFKKMVKIYKKIYPKDFDNFNNYLNEANHGGFTNLFILKKEDFFNYCKWIFSIIDELEKVVSKDNRIIGMLCERLTSYYLWKISDKNENAQRYSYTDIPPRLNIFYLLSKIFNIKYKKNNCGKKTIELIIFGINLNIKV